MQNIIDRAAHGQIAVSRQNHVYRFAHAAHAVYFTLSNDAVKSTHPARRPPSNCTEPAVCPRLISLNFVQDCTWYPDTASVGRKDSP